MPDIGRSDERGRVVGQQCGHAACFGIDFIGMISEKKTPMANGKKKEGGLVHAGVSEEVPRCVLRG